MIYFCPYCGNNLERPLKDGISSCLKCKKIFDTSIKNNLLSAGWMIEKWNIYSLDIIQEKCDIHNSLEIIQVFIDNEYNHDERLAYIKKKIR